MSNAYKILSRLQGVKKVGHRREWWALCPVHGEDTPSLHITEKDDGLLLIHCFGCHASGPDLMETLGLSLADLYGDRPYTECDSGDKWKPEKVPSKSVLDHLQDTIYRERAKR